MMDVLSLKKSLTLGLLVLANSVSADVPVDNKNSLSDPVRPLAGYCGLDCAKACVQSMGVEWERTEATDSLAIDSDASLYLIAAAIDSLGLHTSAYRVTPGNFDSFEALFRRTDIQVSGIA